jgi:hypothetical protein
MFVGVLIVQHPQFDQHLINCRADLISRCGWTYVGVCMQTWGKLCPVILRRSQLFHWKGQSPLMSWSMTESIYMWGYSLWFNCQGNALWVWCDIFHCNPIQTMVIKEMSLCALSDWHSRLWLKSFFSWQFGFAGIDMTVTFKVLVEFSLQLPISSCL